MEWCQNENGTGAAYESAIEPIGRSSSKPSSPGLEPEASLGSIEDFVGITPSLAPHTTDDAPPWQKRSGPLADDRETVRPWHRDQGQQRAQLRKGPISGKSLGSTRTGNVYSSRVSHVELTAKGRWSGKEGSGPAARLVKRPTDAKKHPSRVPPAPPPPPRPFIPSYDSLVRGGAHMPGSDPARSAANVIHPIGGKRITRQKQRAVITRCQDRGHSAHTPRW